MRERTATAEKQPPEPTLQEELAMLGDDDVFDMANLTSGQTGIEGIVFVSTSMGAHGPRVKYFLKPGKTQPSFSVSISEAPRVVASSLPERFVTQISPKVIAWVRLNHDALLSFWNEGDSWMAPQVAQFLNEFQRLG